MRQKGLRFLVLFLAIFSCFTIVASSKGLLPRENIIDECCCSVETVASENERYLRQSLNAIVKTTFFKYFKLNLYADCPFWAVSTFCEKGGCSICECDENEIPVAWRQPEQGCQSDSVTESTQGFQKWKDREANLWTVQDGSESDLSYVNLLQFPETNTGYFAGRNVWAVIYRENCFQGNVADMCLEQRVLYRLVSGLHTSITAHIARFHTKDPVTGEWRSNQTIFDSNIAQHPERAANLYFTFVFFLRAIARASDFLKNYHYTTGNPIEESDIRERIRNFTTAQLLCSPSFDESMLFRDEQGVQAKAELKAQIRTYFQNISLLMNCLNCEKCRVWGKLQVLGLGTALKILMSDRPDEVIADLQRNEIVALINTVRQLSTSLETLELMGSAAEVTPSNTEALPHDRLPPLNLQLVIGFVLALTGALILLLFIRWNNRRCEQKRVEKRANGNGVVNGNGKTQKTNKPKKID